MLETSKINRENLFRLIRPDGQVVCNDRNRQTTRGSSNAIKTLPKTTTNKQPNLDHCLRVTTNVNGIIA